VQGRNHKNKRNKIENILKSLI